MKIEVFDDADAVAERLQQSLPPMLAPPSLPAAGSSWLSAAATRPGSCCAPWRAKTSRGRMCTSCRSTSGSPLRDTRTETSPTCAKACSSSPAAPGTNPCHAGGIARPGGRRQEIRANSSAGRRIAAGTRSGPPGSRARRPHRLAGTRRSGAQRHRRRRRADRRLPGQAPDDVDLSNASIAPAHPLGGDREREG